MKRALVCTVVTAALLASAGCGEGVVHPHFTLDGAWSGVVQPASGSAGPIFMILTQTDTNVVGVGTLTTVNGARDSIAVTGSLVDPHVSLQFVTPANDTVTFVGLFSAGQLMEGKVNGDTYVDAQANLSKS